MKKIYDDEKEEQEFQELDKTKLIVTAVPILLILIILAITLFTGTKGEKASDTDRLQQDIMNYAEESDTPSPTIEPASKAEPTQTPYSTAMEKEVDYSKIKFDEQKNLEEMMAYWADNNQQALDDLAKLDWFRAMSWSLRDTRDHYYYGSVNAAGKPEGIGIAVYGDNQYYYGEWKNGVRSGKGTWIHYHFHTPKNTGDLYTYHQYAGMWKDDLPDGEGQEHYDYDTALFMENARYISNLIGGYKSGLVNGEFYLTSIDSKGGMKEWEAKASEGKWLYYGNNKDKAGRRPVHFELNTDNTEDNYIWLSPKENVNIGVPCLISQNKN